MILHSESCERNKAPLGAVLNRVLPASGIVLEVASGTGQHGAFFAARYPHLQWQPSDQDDRYLQSINAIAKIASLENLRPPLTLDTTAPWPIEHADAIFCANMIHISPWEVTEGLFSGAGRILPSGAPLVTYGPYRIDGEQTAESNAHFEMHLKSLDPRFGIRDLRDLEALGAKHDLALRERIPMPANNFTLVWERA